MTETVKEYIPKFIGSNSLCIKRIFFMPEALQNSTDQTKVNDKLIRIIGVQFFGIVIPNATGLITSNDRSAIYLIFTYGFFILLAFLIWQGNRFFLFRLQKKFDWFIHPLQKMVVLLAMNVFYTAPLVILMLLLWYYGSGNAVDWQVIQTTVLVCVISVIFITHVYETVFLIKQRQSDMVRSEQLERARAEAELEALKNQIDPHFMFNSLNSLSHLIDEDQAMAKQFTESLAEVYRYILSNKERELVLLEDELDFLDKYIALLKLRFGEALQVNFDLETSGQGQYLIPPISVFIALENVVKHNELSKNAPLGVDIEQAEASLTISNPIVKKKSLYHSTKIGLNNLNERFKITVGNGVNVNEEGGHFRLTMPLLKLTS